MNETTKRVISGFTLAFLFAFLFNYNIYHYFFLWLMSTAVVMLTVYEFSNLCNRGEEGRSFGGTIYIASFLMMLFGYFRLVSYLLKRDAIPSAFGLSAKTIHFLAIDFNLLAGLLFFIILISFIRQLTTRPLMGAVFSIGATILAVVYIAMPVMFFLLLLSIKGGVFLIWFGAGTNFITDTGAFIGGKLFGNHPVGFKVSPNKTYEGYFFGVISAVLYGLLVYFVWNSLSSEAPPLSLIEVILLSPILSILSVVGDLAESTIKRDAQKKDSSSAIPGHGGGFDLIDAGLITVPTIYFYAVFKQALSIML